MSVRAQVFDSQAQQALGTLPGAVQTRLREAVQRQTINLFGGVRAAIADIFKSTGPLYQSIRAETTEAPGTVTGRVYSQGIPYAAAQEYGGTWQIPDIFPVNASVLAFMAPGKLGFSGGPKGNAMVFTAHTRAHPVTLPARSYARSTLFRMKAEIAADIAASVAGKP